MGWYPARRLPIGPQGPKSADAIGAQDAILPHMRGTYGRRASYEYSADLQNIYETKTITTYLWVTEVATVTRFSSAIN
jgi:hypothetical protein